LHTLLFATNPYAQAGVAVTNLVVKADKKAKDPTDGNVMTASGTYSLEADNGDSVKLDKIELKVELFVGGKWETLAIDDKLKAVTAKAGNWTAQPIPNLVANQQYRVRTIMYYSQIVGGVSSDKQNVAEPKEFVFVEECSNEFENAIDKSVCVEPAISVTLIVPIPKSGSVPSAQR